MTHSTLEDPISSISLAIIGMAGRFPGANSIEAFWKNIAGGIKSIRHFSDEELLAAGLDPELLTLPNYVKAGAILDSIDHFDAAFFGYTPREAEIMDPQHRLFLECSWEAFESAGYVPDTYTGLVGVFGGSGFSTYGANNLYTHPELVASVGELQINLGNDRDSLATMVSYKLNLKGPGITVQTFCSTSLVAIHLACQSLITYECDIALAGGVAISVPQERGYLYEEGGILSPNGECRTFDARAQGSVMGNGVGVVALKRLADAIADGDHICAVIRGSAVNNDGSLRVSYTAPGLSGQTEVIAEALGHADVTPETITFIEAHGTATMLGDAVELAAMLKAFGSRTHKKRFCAIGSVKPNVGHLDRASGVTGLIKTTLALQHRQLPPSLNFEQTSSDIDLENSPFYVNTSLRDWPSHGIPRRAGVSSFGMGGTNAHVVVEEAPVQTPSSPSTYHPLLLLSARTVTALKTAATNLSRYLSQHPSLNMADVAYTLQVGRTAWNHRCALLCRNRDDAIANLERVASGDIAPTCQTLRNRPVTFFLSGQSASAVRIARELYHEEPLFRNVIDQCCGLLDTSLAQDIRKVFISTSVITGQSRQMRLVASISEYALACLFIEWDIHPQALVASGSSEYIAACLAGILSLKDALALLAYHDQPAKRMDILQTIQFHSPRIPYISSLSGTWITAEQATNSLYWLKLVESDQPVYGITGVSHLLQDAQHVLLEIGVGQSCSYAGLDMLPAIASEDESASPMSALHTTLGRLWLAGVVVDWSNLYCLERRLRVPLPTYPFERQRYWIDPPPNLTQNVESKQPDSVKLSNIADWFYLPVWKQTPLPLSPSQRTPSFWLIFMDDCGLGERLSEQLAHAGHTVVQVHAGKQFACQSTYCYTLCPGEQRDYVALCRALRDVQQLPDKVVHCWSLTGSDAQLSGSAAFIAQQKTGFYSLLYLAQALGTEVFEKPVQIDVIANHLQAVTQQEPICPEKKTLLGACTVIPQENANLICRAIDVVLPGGWSNTLLIDQLFAELTGTATGPVLALREGERWIQTYQPTHLPPVDLKTNRLRQRGVYLITGGLGKVGLVIAAYLAKTLQARLILLGRSGLPAKSEWNRWLETHESDDEISLTIRQVQALEVSGAEVLLIQADVVDVASLSAVLEQVYEKFGTLHGVIHAAGSSSAEAFKMVQESDPTSCDKHFQAKVYGVYALEQVLRGRTLDFCLLFSSISAILGGLSFVGYTAANLFMDAFVHQHSRQHGTPWISVNWDTWQFQEHAHGVLGSTVAGYAMTPDEGIEAFVRVLASGVSRVVNSTGDLSARMRQWVMLEGIRGSTSSHQQLKSSAPTEDISVVQHGQRTDYERLVRTIWQEVLGVEQVGLHENYFELGGNSLNGLQVIARLRSALHRPIPIVALFEAPTISTLATYLQPTMPVSSLPIIPDPLTLLQERRQRLRQTGSAAADSHDIALIAMSGRFPGAGSIEAFWHNLHEGIESLTHFSDEQLLAAGVDPALLAHPAYVKARPILPVEQVEGFDAAFFGYSPREAELLDPQLRLFLECAWEALERACYDPSRYKGLIGVFGGANVSSYWHTLLQNPQLVMSRKEQVSDVQLAMSLDKDALTTTVSYKLNLRGPSVGVQTFCSTSLVAVHLAVQSLRHGDCDLALAGGVSVRVPVQMGYLYQPGGQNSPDGQCRSFDADASGSTFGDGAGIVVLKRLSEALADGDQVLAVIKGSALNNDGAGKVSYAAPSVGGQASVVRAALADAGVSAGSISYVEAHGSATLLGDPIEVRALSKAFADESLGSELNVGEQVGWCRLGSVKTNVGHLDRAAGVTGLIKTVLALQHEQLPASLHYQRPNPQVDFASSPFVVNASLTPWLRGAAPRRAGVNALGMGGTNAHVVVEEAPLPQPSSHSRPWQLVLLSARTESALEHMASNLGAWVGEQWYERNAVSLADVAYSLQVGRQRFAHRRFLLCQHGDEVEAFTQTQVMGRIWSRQDEREERGVVFALPGIGEPFGTLVAQLYGQEETFRWWVDRCCSLLTPLLGKDLRDYLLSTSALAQEEQWRQQTSMMQPATFVVEYALAQLLMQWGIRSQAMLGYSLGEYVAACLAGVFSLEDALRVVVRRAQLIEALPHGAMLAVALSEQEVQPYLNEQVSLAAINAPHTCVLAGPCHAIKRLEDVLRECAIASIPVATTHAFHSPLLQPVRPALMEFMADIHLHAPRLPYLSSMTGDWITEEQATNPHYWAEQMCQPVRFADGVGRLLADSEAVVLEVGIGQALCSFVKQHPSCDKARFSLILPTLPTANEEPSAQAALLATVGKLWLAGVEIDWSGFYLHERRQRVVLPTYPFERQRYWIDTRKASASDNVTALVEQEGEKCSDLSDWFYLPSWQQTAASFPSHMAEQADNPQCWLVFVDSHSPGYSIAELLTISGQDVVTVTAGTAFSPVGSASYAIRPTAYDDYESMLKALRSRGKKPMQIVHLWTGNPLSFEHEESNNLDIMLERSFYSLITLAQALGNLGMDACQLTVVSCDMYDVTGNEQLCPEKATVLGPCKVIPQEYPNIRCRNIDISFTSGSHDGLIAQLLRELTAGSDDPVVALRGRHRWIQVFEPIKLEGQLSRQSVFRTRGVYMITGGLGGIGLAMAAYLAKTAQARLVLVGRTAFPHRSAWSTILSSEGASTDTGRQIRQILALEALGAEVLLVQADVSNEVQMRNVIRQSLSTFGTLHGVLHLAGVPASGLLQLKTQAMAEQVLAPKVRGTLVLASVLKDIPLDFLVLFSSICSATGGGPGQVDYCAANAFLDAFAHAHFLEHGMTVAIDWGEWQWDAWVEGLNGYPAEAQQYFRQRRQTFGISFEEGAEALCRVLQRKIPHLVVSTEDFQHMVVGSQNYSIATIMQEIHAFRQAQTATGYARPALGTEYVAPGNELEQEIATIWGELLGIEQIGIYDNFFELGGHSLMGTQLMTRLRQSFQIDISLTTLFEAPTIAELAMAIELILIEEIEQMNEGGEACIPMMNS